MPKNRKYCEQWNLHTHYVALIVTLPTAVIASEWGGTSLSLRRAWFRGFHALRKLRDVPPRQLAVGKVMIKASH